MIRHNFLTDAAAAKAFIDGVKILKDPVQSPWPGQDGLSIYDVFVFWHHQSMMLMTPPSQSDRNAAHSGPAFLPWHRYFLLTLERFLQQALEDTDFRLPYWDWNADAELPNPATSAIWTNTNLGQFIGASWQIRLAMNAQTGNLQRVNRRLQRSLGTAPVALPTRTQLRDAVRNATYDQTPFSSSSSGGVRNVLEGWVGPAGLHNMVHVWVGGDMQYSSSPNDPTFFLHHCNVDRAWAAWQALHPNAVYEPSMSAPASLQFHRIDDALYSIFDETVTPRQMVDYKPMYEYDTLTDLTT